MKKAFAVLLAIGLVVICASAVFAQRRSEVRKDTIEERITHQEQRIQQGLRAKSLTPHEADVLRDNLRHIKQERTRLMRDGRLDPREYDRLSSMLDENSAQIESKKHDRPIRKLY